MSICVSVKVGEGLVLAADSTSVITGTQPDGQVGVLNIYEYARKLCQVKDYPLGAMSWGIGSIGARSIESLIAEYSNTLPQVKEKPEYKAKELADNLFDFVKQRYDGVLAERSSNSQIGPPLGLFMGGFSAGKFFPETYNALLPVERALKEGRPDREDGNPNFGANWYGQTDAIVRWHLGFAPELADSLIKQKGWTKEDVDTFVKQFQYPVAFDGMPLQDAIDFADYLVRLVIGRFRFVLGVPTCGGPVDIAVLTPGQFTWVRRKEWRAGPVH